MLKGFQPKKVKCPKEKKEEEEETKYTLAFHAEGKKASTVQTGTTMTPYESMGKNVHP